MRVEAEAEQREGGNCTGHTGSNDTIASANAAITPPPIIS